MRKVRCLDCIGALAAVDRMIVAGQNKSARLWQQLKHVAHGIRQIDFVRLAGFGPLAGQCDRDAIQLPPLERADFIAPASAQDQELYQRSMKPPALSAARHAVRNSSSFRNRLRFCIVGRVRLAAGLAEIASRSSVAHRKYALATFVKVSLAPSPRGPRGPATGEDRFW